MQKITFLLFIVFFGFSKVYSTNDTLINAHATWKYLDNGSNQGTAWKGKLFNDASWPSGIAQFGYGDGDESTVVNYGPDANNKYITTYFRKSFTVSNPSQYSSVQLQLLRDDGARVFLNGNNVAKSNLPAGAILYNTLAKSNQGAAKENKYYLFTINATSLLTGNNVIAVEVHQYNVTSDDLGFDLRLIGSFPGCDAASNLSASNITTTGAQLDWTNVNGAISYNVQYRIAGSGSWTTLSASTNSLNLSSLSPATSYEWQVQTVCSSDSSVFSSGANFATQVPPCDIPAGLASANITTSAADLAWDAISGAISYNIQYRIVGSGSWTLTSSSTNAITISPLIPAANYEWQAQTVCSLSTSAFSSSANFSTSAPPCDVPSGMSSSNITETTAGLTWTAVSGAINYNVQYRIIGSATWLNASSATNALTLSSLNPASNYEWQVRAVCSSNSSLFSASSNFTTLTPPPCNTPAGISVTGVSSSSATVNWSPVSGALNYMLQYRLTGGSWNQVSSASTSVSLTGLTPARTYQCQVQAVCQFSSGSFSSSVSFTTQQSTGIVTIQRGPYLQMLTPNSIHIRWKTDVSTNSRVRYGTNMDYGATIDSSASVTEHEIKISGLTPDTKYYYTIGSTAIDLQGDPNNYFKTSLPTGSTAPFRVWAIGDFGNGSSSQDAVRNAYTTYAGSNPANFWIWMGDNAYNTGTETEFTNNVFAKYPAIMKNTPLFPGLGNHDYANAGYQTTSTLGTNFPYFSLFTCPKNGEAGGVASATEKYYSFNYGNAHFIALDSYGSLNNSGSPMYTWLQNDLNANTQRWIVVYFHHPPYTMGTHNSDNDIELINMRQNILPLLEIKKVDLVLCGHSHVYERSFLLNGHYGLENSITGAMKIDATNGMSPYYLKSSPNFTGTVYTVCGVSGQGGNQNTAGSWPHEAMFSYAKTLYGSMVLDFSNDTLHAKFLTSTGTIYDQFKIVKSGSAKFETDFFVDEKASGDLAVYPNPFSETLVLRFYLEEPGPVTIEVADLMGRIIYSEKNRIIQSKGVQEVHLKEDCIKSPSGMFVISVKTDSEIMNKRVEKIW